MAENSGRSDTQIHALPSRATRRAAGPRADVAPVAVEDISRRAYEIFLRRGGSHGRDMDDWFQAEAELRGQRRAEAVVAKPRAGKSSGSRGRRIGSD